MRGPSYVAGLHTGCILWRGKAFEEFEKTILTARDTLEYSSSS